MNPATTYSVTRSYRLERGGNDKDFWTYPGSLFYSGSVLYAGMKADVGGGNDRFKVVRYDLSGGNVIWEYTLDRGDKGAVMSIINGASSDIFVAGWEEDNSLNKYAVIARIMKTQGNSNAVNSWYRGAN